MDTSSKRPPPVGPTETLRLERPAPLTSAQTAKGLKLEWVDERGAQAPQTKVVTRSVVLGTSPNVDVILEDRTASRLHAELELRADGAWIRDLQSSNGTFVQGLRVERALVPHFGRIRLGHTTIVLSHTRAEEAAGDDGVWPEAKFHDLIGGSAKMRALYATLAKLAVSEAPILIQGETGTGKELIARSIHKASSRASGPLVVVDCAALPDTLLDAELFGHVRGAFTGAVGARAGAIESANGGTVFLDEIGELPLSMQPKLLRVLEAKTVRRLGESNHRPVDVRFVFATHRDLLRMVSAGELREDLYFRLSVLLVHAPALRERLDDLEVLVSHFLGNGEPVSADLLADLSSRPWHGNVRELRNFVDRMVALGSTRALALADTGQFPSLAPPAAEAPPSAPAVEVAEETAMTPAAVATEGSLRGFKDRWNEQGEQLYVRDLLARHDRSVSSAAREAEVDRTYLYKLIRKYGL